MVRAAFFIARHVVCIRLKGRDGSLSCHTIFLVWEKIGFLCEPRDICVNHNEKSSGFSENPQ